MGSAPRRHLPSRRSGGAVKRTLRMLFLCIVAAVLSAHISINFIVVMVAALALEESRLGDVVVVVFSAFCLDTLMGLPIGLSILPLTAMMLLIRILKSQIYLQALTSRLVWVMVAVLSFYSVMGVQLLIRTGLSLYLWDGVLWGAIHSVVEGLLAAILSPYVHRFLTANVEDIRMNRDTITLDPR